MKQKREGQSTGHTGRFAAAWVSMYRSQPGVGLGLAELPRKRPRKVGEIRAKGWGKKKKAEAEAALEESKES